MVMAAEGQERACTPNETLSAASALQGHDWPGTGQPPSLLEVCAFEFRTNLRDRTIPRDAQAWSSRKPMRCGTVRTTFPMCWARCKNLRPGSISSPRANVVREASQGSPTLTASGSEAEPSAVSLPVRGNAATSEAGRAVSEEFRRDRSCCRDSRCGQCAAEQTEE